MMGVFLDVGGSTEMDVRARFSAIPVVGTSRKIMVHSYLAVCLCDCHFVGLVKAAALFCRIRTSQ